MPFVELELIDGPKNDRALVRTIICVGVVAVWAIPFVRYVPGDFTSYLGPWYAHILQAGPIGAFAHPFGNYSPPYLYLLAALTLLNGLLPAYLLTKLASAAGALWLSWAVYRLASVAGAEQPVEAALWTLLIPSVVLNVPTLGQADVFWTAPCILAVAAAIRRNSLRMVLWAGLAFAIKAQAIFLAPFVIAMLIRDRAPWHRWLVPACVYMVAIAPAWLAGWPLADLLTVYVRQFQWTPYASISFMGEAANPWVVGSLFAPSAAMALAPLGYIFAALAAAAYIVSISRRNLDARQLIAAAALSAIALPWLLPKMHERFFILGELLAFAYAFACRSRRGAIIATLMQLEAICSVYGFLISRSDLAIGGAFFVMAAMALLAEDLGGNAAARTAPTLHDKQFCSAVNDLPPAD